MDIYIILGCVSILAILITAIVFLVAKSSKKENVKPETANIEKPEAKTEAPAPEPVFTNNDMDDPPAVKKRDLIQKPAETATVSESIFKLPIEKPKVPEMLEGLIDSRTISRTAKLETVPGFIPESSREIVMERDGHTCRYCGSTEDLTVVNLLPTYKRGILTEVTMVTACRSCAHETEKTTVQRTRDAAAATRPVYQKMAS